MRIVFGVLVSLVFLFSGCALLISGRYQKVNIVSSASGASVFLNGDYADTTPCVLSVRRNKIPPTISINKKGFVPESFQLHKKTNPIIFLNLFDIPGWLIDIGVGANIKYSEIDTLVLIPKKTSPR
jgi:hypothetical protein